MKPTILSLFAAALSFSAAAQPIYTTLNASGTATSVVFFASSPAQQIRVVQAIASSDLATANLTFRSGTTPLTITKTNVAGTTIDVASTNGFAVGTFVMVETAAGTITNAQIASFTGSTNIVFADKIMATLPGDQIYKLGTAVVLFVGSATNRAFSGEAVFVGGRGRPVQVIVNGTSSCSLDAISARYE